MVAETPREDPPRARALGLSLGAAVARRSAQPEPPKGTPLDLSHLRREARAALELAVVALAPAPLVDRLAAAAGLLEALVELPANSPPVTALIPRVQSQSKKALDEWQRWHEEHLEKRLPRG